MDTLLSVATMYGGEHPLLLDRRAKLVPVADSYRLPAFYSWLLFPFSEHKAR